MHAPRFIVLYYEGIRHERRNVDERSWEEKEEEKKKKGSFVKAASGNQD